jgi:hypothetical protein
MRSLIVKLAVNQVIKHICRVSARPRIDQDINSMIRGLSITNIMNSYRLAGFVNLDSVLATAITLFDRPSSLDYRVKSNGAHTYNYWNAKFTNSIIIGRVFVIDIAWPRGFNILLAGTGNAICVAHGLSIAGWVNREDNDKDTIRIAIQKYWSHAPYYAILDEEFYVKEIVTNAK